MIISRNAPVKLAIRGNNAAHCMASLVGRIITSTPMNPTNTAHQRRQPTISFKKKDAIAVTNKGPAKVMATVSARGKYDRPVTKQKVPVTTKPARNNCHFKLTIRIWLTPPARQIKYETGINTKTPRTNIICPVKYPPVNHLRTASFAVNNKPATTM